MNRTSSLLASSSQSKNRWCRSLVATAICAAATLAMSATASTVIYTQDFGSCTTSGFAVTGLWHAATLGACSPLQPGCGLYFGQDSTCDYDTGVQVSGTATSPTIDLSAYASATLSFDYRLETEFSPCLYDFATVEISDDGFATSTVVADQNCGAPVTLDDGGGWVSASVDLSAWAGSAIQVRFRFDSDDELFNDYFGFAVTNVDVEGEPIPPSLSLEGTNCQDDVLPGEPGHQIAVGVWMRNVAAPGATGFQGFVEFDQSELVYRDDLSSYTAGPFPLHILQFGAAPPFQVEWAAGRLRLDGSAAPSDPPSVGNAQLATLIFDVVDECATTDLSFGGYPASPFFFSELSIYGTPVITDLEATGTLALDDTDPLVTCPSNITVAADVSFPICDVSNCCSSHGGTGCSDGACTTTVCGLDSFCCVVSWDNVCANEAILFCGPIVDPCNGAIVSFTPTAADNCDVSPTVVSTPPSGSLFPIGTTTVTCVATDDCGNTDTCTFDVTVTPTNQVLADVKLLVGTFTAPTATRCIRFQADDCSAATDESIVFSNDGLGYQASGPVLIELPCGEWSSLCVKDEQHSKWETVGLSAAGDHWLAAPQVVLVPGDDDNDGDVDINDVTWLIFTFSAPAAANPCPFVFPGPGPRDADFSLDGAVAGEDYSLLSDQFLTFSSCVCTLPSQGSRFDERRSLPISEVDARLRDHIDLNRDGSFDAEDVLLFETQRGFPNTLSNRLRTERPTGSASRTSSPKGQTR